MGKMPQIVDSMMKNLGVTDLTVETPRIIDPTMENMWVFSHTAKAPQIVDPMMNDVRFKYLTKRNIIDH